MKTTKFFWGLFLFSLGLLILLSYYSSFSLKSDTILKLWPLILILAGLKILIKHRIWDFVIVSVSAILLALIIFSLIFMNFRCGSFRFDFDTSQQKKEVISQPLLPNIKHSELDITFNVGELQLKSLTEKLIDGEVYFVNDNYRFEGEIFDSIATFKLISEDNKKIGVLSNKIRNNLILDINPKPNWKIKLRTNFTKNGIELTDVRLNKIEIYSNFSKGNISLSPNVKTCNSNLEFNFCKYELIFSDSIGVEIRINKTFSTITADDFEEIEPNLFRSRNFEEAQRKIIVVLDLNFSKVSIKQI